MALDERIQTLQLLINNQADIFIALKFIVMGKHVRIGIQTPRAYTYLLNQKSQHLNISFKLMKLFLLLF